MGQVIDGKALAAKIRGQIAEQTQSLKLARGIVPGLAAIRVGDDPASKVYVGSKEKAWLSLLGETSCS
jgi:methylenetetrahydrofolate dehydrogenase (NADP+) / methenyltetrahydrofolate cyclohydrolase